jgi:3-hydroxybutyrate dehydrogenase
MGIAQALAEEGCSIVLNGFGDPNEIENVRDHIARTHGVKVVYSPADLAKQDAVSVLVSQATREYDRVDILVNDAGTVEDPSRRGTSPKPLWRWTVVGLRNSTAPSKLFSGQSTTPTSLVAVDARFR